MKHPFGGHKICIVDAIRVTTVQKLTKIIAEKGKKIVGKTKSDERGTTVTMVFAVNTIGNSLPPCHVCIYF